MPTYNFTVRASDDTGAYADRDFSINVKNTVVDRFMLLSGKSAYGSPNLSEWRERPNASQVSLNSRGYGNYSAINYFRYMPYTSLVFNNGRWISYHFRMNTGSVSGDLKIEIYLSYSEDGINWNSINSINVDGYEIDISSIIGRDDQGKYCTIGRIVKHKNMLYTIASYYINEAHVVRLVRSEDGVNWSSNLGTNSEESIMAESNIGFLSPNDGLSIIGNNWFYNAALSHTFGENANKIMKSTDVNGTSWTHMTVPAALQQEARYCNVYYFNGMYIVLNRINFFTSIDGMNWVTRTIPSLQSGEYPCEIVYGNGQLVMTTFVYGTSAVTRNKVLTSSNGIDWSVVEFNGSYGTINPRMGNASFPYPGITKFDITFSNGRFILGSDMNVMTGGMRISYDGIDWATLNGNGIPTTINGLAALNP